MNAHQIELTTVGKTEPRVDSRLLAKQAVLAFERADLAAQNEFLHHCVTCHDNLAFMLARRALLKTATALPGDWEAVSLQLEQARELV